MKLTVGFQTRANGGANGSNSCDPDKIFLHSNDIKALKLKSGAWIAIECDSSSPPILCRAWPSKKAVQGSCVLHRIWAPNFGVSTASDARKSRTLIRSILPEDMVCRPCSSISVSFCSRISTGRQSAGGSGSSGGSIRGSEDLLAFIRGVILSSNICLAKGMKLSMTYFSDVIEVKV